MRLNSRLRQLGLLAGILIAIVSACAQSQRASDLRPTIILISVDGFRYDYLQKYDPPNLELLAREGVRAKWMTPSFPSKTFPNHYTIVTGLYPQNNGIVENTVYDRASKITFSMSNREQVQDGRWWLGEPIWITAEKKGQKTAPLFWPGSEAEISGVRPTYWKPYDGKVTDEARVDMILSWLDLPSAERPTLLTLYFSDVDNAGHDFGPNSAKTRDAVLKVDHAIARLIGGLKARQIFDKVNLIVVSDHGMTTQNPNKIIILDELFDTTLAEKILWTDEIVSIFPNEGKEDEIYKSLKKKLPRGAKVFRKTEVPARFHYSTGARIAPLLVLPDDGWRLMTRKRFEEKKAEGQMNAPRGGHGYDNDLISMRAIFIGRGPAFKRSVVIEPFNNTDVYNLMCEILGLMPAPNDGDSSLARVALKGEKKPAR